MTTPYQEALAEYVTTPLDIRYDCNAAHYLDEFELPAGDAISADEARAGATPKGLIRLNSLEIPKGPRIRDAFSLIPMDEWAERAAHLRAEEESNRLFISLTLRQLVGSCACEGISGATMFTEEKQGQAAEKLNAYALYRRVNGGRDAGSNPGDALAAAIKYGIPSERVWPRKNSWRVEPSKKAHADALLHRPVEHFRVSNIEEFGTALFMGFGVYAGYKGHAWFGVDVLDDKRLLYKDSQGPTYGDDGFIVLKWSSIYWPYGAWAIRTAVRSS